MVSLTAGVLARSGVSAGVAISQVLWFQHRKCFSRGGHFSRGIGGGFLVSRECHVFCFLAKMNGLTEINQFIIWLATEVLSWVQGCEGVSIISSSGWHDKRL